MMNIDEITQLAQDIGRQAELLTEVLRQQDPSRKELEFENELWDEPSPVSELGRVQTNLLASIDHLNKCVRGPRGWLYNLVASNWEKGALYTILQHNVLELIPVGMSVPATRLSDRTGIPVDKLLPILRLAACDKILHETETEVFGHGVFSRALLGDPRFKAFIQFQLYETRIASAHLADSLKNPNPTWTGESAFAIAFGKPMYDWLESNPKNGERFSMAMKNVSASLDPGIKLLENWFATYFPLPGQPHRAIMDIAHQGAQTSSYLADKYPHIEFKQYTLPKYRFDLEIEQEDTDRPYAYILRSVLWTLPDDDCISILQALVPLVEKNPRSSILVNDLMSPKTAYYGLPLDKAFRRRDVTVMTMHNAKVRTCEEWESLFMKACPRFMMFSDAGITSHSCRGQWELRLREVPQKS